MSAVTPRLAFAFAITLGACAPHLQTLELRNDTPRVIEALYVYPSGAENHGPSRGSLAPNASTTLHVKPGHVAVLAESAMVKLDETTRDKPTASSELELTRPLHVVFYDRGNAPAELSRQDVIGVEFILLHPRGDSSQ
jgi:hypothetical protein